MTMFRLSWTRDFDTEIDRARIPMLLDSATPAGLVVSAAYLDERSLVVYVDVDADAQFLIAGFIDRVDLGPCSTTRVDVLALGRDGWHTAAVAETGLAGLRPAELVGVAVAGDDRSLTARVRHKPYERIDRVDVKETVDTVELTVWVGAPPGDGRRDYVTLRDAFSSVTIDLEQPLATRRVVESQ
jgi:hypothetical protein